MKNEATNLKHKQWESLKKIAIVRVVSNRATHQLLL